MHLSIIRIGVGMLVPLRAFRRREGAGERVSNRDSGSVAGRANGGRRKARREGIGPVKGGHKGGGGRHRG